MTVTKVMLFLSVLLSQKRSSFKHYYQAVKQDWSLFGKESFLDNFATYSAKFHQFCSMHKEPMVDGKNLFYDSQ